MLQNWLKPIPTTVQKSLDALPSHALGKNLVVYTDKLPSLKGVRLALIGAGDKEANAVRKSFYQMSYPFPKGSIADLGNLRRAEPGVLIPLMFELLSGNVLPVLLSRKNELASAQFLAYQEFKSLANLVVVDECFRLGNPKSDSAELAVYTPLLKPQHKLLFHFGLVGYQIHQTVPAWAEWLHKHNFDALRLGKTRQALEEAEPVLRDADLLTFHLSALKQAEAPGVLAPSPSGYFVEEACQLCRYAGMSDKLTSFGIYGFQLENEQGQQTGQAISQMLWYFLDGFFGRKNDFPASKTDLVEYIVDFRQLNYQLTFWKSSRSGRWWMQTPVNTQKKYQRHYLIPCSYQDYQAACREELPDRLMQALSRFD